VEVRCVSNGKCGAKTCLGGGSFIFQVQGQTSRQRDISMREAVTEDVHIPSSAGEAHASAKLALYLFPASLRGKRFKGSQYLAKAANSHAQVVNSVGIGTISTSSPHLS
jgi:hypothetical protein